MNFNFDEQINRKNTNSIKYDFAAERGKPDGIIPLWVADMDFKAPPAVTDALLKSVQHGIFGYADSKQGYFDALHNWYAARFGWEIKPAWLVKTPSIVYAIATAIRALTQKGDAILIQQPVYHPFANMIRANERKLINNALVCENGIYQMDFSDFESKVIENKVKLFILCSPHNPVGRVWSVEELVRLGDICVKHGVTVISDEIHADFVFEGHKHFIFASLKPEFLQCTVTCTAPSKTFNLAGLQVSNLLIANEQLRQKFEHEMTGSGYNELNAMGLVSCQAAYTYGAEWLDELIVYLAGNLSLIRDFLAQRIPSIRLIEPQGTYLVWLDLRGLGLTEEERDHLLVHKAGLWLNSGTMFGADGEGFERLNMACPRATLETALLRLEQAVNSIAK